MIPVLADLLHSMSSLPRDLNFIDHTSDIGWKEYGILSLSLSFCVTTFFLSHIISSLYSSLFSVSPLFLSHHYLSSLAFSTFSLLSFFSHHILSRLSLIIFLPLSLSTLSHHFLSITTLSLLSITTSSLYPLFSLLSMTSFLFSLSHQFLSSFFSHHFLSPHSRHVINLSFLLSLSPLHPSISYPCSHSLANFSLNPRIIASHRFQRAKPIIIDPGLYLSKKEDVFWITQRRSVPTAFKLFTGETFLLIFIFSGLSFKQVQVSFEFLIASLHYSHYFAHELPPKTWKCFT